MDEMHAERVGAWAGNYACYDGISLCGLMWFCYRMTRSGAHFQAIDRDPIERVVGSGSRMNCISSLSGPRKSKTLTSADHATSSVQHKSSIASKRL
jgi:hypothetical protein